MGLFAWMEHVVEETQVNLDFELESDEDRSLSLGKHVRGLKQVIY